MIVHKRRDWDLADPQGAARRYAYRDNRVSEVGLTWDVEQLLADVNAGVDLSALWTEGELDVLLAGLRTPVVEDAGAQIDRAAELQAVWNVERGQLWTIASKSGRGEHRLLCGDSTNADDVARVGKIDVLVTDPPYGIGVDTSWLTALNVKRGKPANMSDDQLRGDDGSLDLSFLFKYDRRMIWGFPYIFDPQATGWIVWDKQPGVNERGIVTPVEMASTTMRKGFDMVRCMWGGFYRAAGEKREPHPTQKPVQVFTPFIEDWTETGNIIFDPFGGSGTTMVACEQLARQCRMIEIEPKYCAVILQRMTDMGLEPTLG